MTCPSCHQMVPRGAPHCPACGAPQEALPAGTRLQGYHLDRPLQRDAGLAYLAVQEATGQQVVLLEFFPPDARRFGMLVLLTEQRKNQLARWVERARAWQQGPGGSIPRPLEVFERNATAYAVFSEPPGRTLTEQVSASGPLLAEQASQLVRQLLLSAADLLAAGHPVGELDPSRLLLQGDRQWLGLGWAEEALEAYRAPELWIGPATETVSSILYSIGAVGRFALTGQAPPAAPYRALGAPLPSLPAGLPAGLVSFLEDATHLQAHQRPASLLDPLQPPAQGGEARESIQPLRIAAHQSWVTHIAMNSQVMVTAGADQQVKVWTVTGRPVNTLAGVRAAPVGLALLPAGIVVADASGRLHCWAGNTYASSDSGSGIERLCALNGGRAVTHSDRQHLQLWQLPTVQALGADPQAGRDVTALHEGHAGTLILGTRDGRVLRYDPQHMQTELIMEGLPGAVTALAVNSCGLVAAGAGATIHLQARAEVITFPHSVQALTFGGPEEVLLMSAGSRLYRLGSQDGEPQVLQETASRVRCLTATASHAAAGLEDGQILVVPLLGPPASSSA